MMPNESLQTKMDIFQFCTEATLLFPKRRKPRKKSMKSTIPKLGFWFNPYKNIQYSDITILKKWTLFGDFFLKQFTSSVRFARVQLFAISLLVTLKNEPKKRMPLLSGLGNCITQDIFWVLSVYPIDLCYKQEFNGNLIIGRNSRAANAKFCVLNESGYSLQTSTSGERIFCNYPFVLFTDCAMAIISTFIDILLLNFESINSCTAP